MNFLLHRKIAICMLFIALTGLGYVSYKQLPVELLPNAELPMLFVQVTSAQDMDPSYVESEVVIPIEGAIGTIGGVEQIESLIDSRQSSIKIDFKSNINFKITALKLQEKINEIASSLPEGFTVQVQKIDVSMLAGGFMSLGAACVLFMKNELSVKTTKMLSGFAAGVMIAASVWSLLIPALEQSQSLGKMQFVPAVAGFMLGMFFLLILDTITPHMHLDNSVEGPKSNFSRQTMMVLAVTLHNIPEGMAVGVLYASWISGTTTITRAAALSLAIGIAIQNFPEGAIISMPLHSTGNSKLRAFVYGVLSGIVEPIAGILTILAIGIIEPVMPYLLSFAAGAMIYVVIEELVPEMSEGGHSNRATIAFMVGFCLMMTLDVMLG